MAGSPRGVFGVLFPASVSESFGRDIGQSSIWKVFYSISVENIFIMKNLTDFRNTLEAGVDPRLLRFSEVQIQKCDGESNYK